MEIKCGRAELSCAIIICYVISPNLLHQIKLQNYIYFQPFTSHKAAASLELELSAKNLRRRVKIYFQSRWYKERKFKMNSQNCQQKIICVRQILLKQFKHNNHSDT